MRGFKSRHGSKGERQPTKSIPPFKGEEFFEKQKQFVERVRKKNWGCRKKAWGNGEKIREAVPSMDPTT